MNTRIGELDQRVTLYSEQQTSDGMGGTETEWVEEGTVWAHIRPQSGSERLETDTTVAEGRMRMWIRNQGLGRDLTETWRVVWYGRTFNIDWLGPVSPRGLYREVMLTVGAPA